MMKTIFYFFVFCSFFISNSHAIEFDGSFSLMAHQRFFSDPRFVESTTGQAYKFNRMGTIDTEATFGFIEIIPGLEPILGVSYLMKTSKGLPGLPDVNGQPSQDKFTISFVTVSPGVRYNAWSPKFFMIIPYADARISSRWGWFKKKTSAVGAKKSISGWDLGMILGTGAIVSFMTRADTRSEMTSEWDVKDFGLIASIRYLPSGFMKKGLGQFKSSGGWDFGAGLFLDW